jgi:hypothetical protein
MRSVVVVLPYTKSKQLSQDSMSGYKLLTASTCAIIPMFRVFSSIELMFLVPPAFPWRDLFNGDNFVTAL